jgi:hypothetical protein
MVAHIRRLPDKPGLWIVVEVVDNRNDRQRAALGFPSIFDVLNDEDIKRLRAIGCKFLIRGEP